MLTPEEVQSREFVVSLRGYDRGEVHAFLGRVAEQLAHTEAKATQLQQRLDRLQAQQPHTAAAAEPSPVAQQDVAAPEPSAMFAEIGRETQRILEASQEAGQQIQRRARQEADRELQAARGAAAKLIAEGERRREHIERVVSELEQARAAMSVQLRGIGRTIEQTLRELGPAEGSETVREAIGAQARADAQDGRDAEAAADAEVAREGEAAARRDTAADAASAAPQPATDAAPAAPQPVAADAAPAAQTATQPGDKPADQPAPAAPAPALDGDSAAPVEAEPPALGRDEDDGAQAPAAPAPSGTAGAAGPGSDDPQGLRAAALSPLHPKLVRKVKRELQEIQNIALDKVRRAKGRGEADDFLPGDEDTSGLGVGAGDLLVRAWQAGVRAAGVLADRDLPSPPDTPDLGGDFLQDASQRVRSGLSSTLRMGLSAEESAQALSERIGAVFGEFKGPQAEELAATHLIRAYERGLLDAWSSGDVPARRWVMGREPRCPQARCRNNNHAQDVPVDQPFPSGHDVPPVHVGCTCTTVPAPASTP